MTSTARDETARVIERLESAVEFLDAQNDWVIAIRQTIELSVALIKSQSIKIDKLETASRTRPDYDLRCQVCDAPHWLDTSIPSEIWNQIAEPSDLLCMLCIDDRLVKAGLRAEAEFYFNGCALDSRMYWSPGEIEQAHTALRVKIAELEGELTKETTLCHRMIDERDQATTRLGVVTTVAEQYERERDEARESLRAIQAEAAPILKQQWDHPHFNPRAPTARDRTVALLRKLAALPQ